MQTDTLLVSQDVALILRRTISLRPNSVASLVPILKALRKLNRALPGGGALNPGPVLGGRAQTELVNGLAGRNLHSNPLMVRELALSSSTIELLNDIVMAPCVFAAVRTGHYFAAALATLSIISEARPAGFILNSPERTPENAEAIDLIEGAGKNVTVFDTSTRGIAGALRLLKEGGCLFVTTDVLSDAHSAISVAFAGGIKSVMTGAAFLAQAAGVSMYAATPFLTDDLESDVVVSVVKFQDYSDVDQRLSPEVGTDALWRELSTHRAMTGTDDMLSRNYRANPSLYAALRGSDLSEQAALRVVSQLADGDPTIRAQLIDLIEPFGEQAIA